MKDQVDSLRQLGIAAVYINSSVSKAQLYKDLQDISAGFYKIIYIHKKINLSIGLKRPYLRFKTF